MGKLGWFMSDINVTSPPREDEPAGTQSEEVKKLLFPELRFVVLRCLQARLDKERERVEPFFISPVWLNPNSWPPRFRVFDVYAPSCPLPAPPPLPVVPLAFHRPSPFSEYG